MEEEIRNKIRAYIQRKGITSNKLARMARVEPASLHRFLKESRSISLGTAEKLLQVVDAK